MDTQTSFGREGGGFSDAARRSAGLPNCLTWITFPLFTGGLGGSFSFFSFLGSKSQRFSSTCSSVSAVPAPNKLRNVL
jgi:hypothetical protein